MHSFKGPAPAYNATANIRLGRHTQLPMLSKWGAEAGTWQITHATHDAKTDISRICLRYLQRPGASEARHSLGLQGPMAAATIRPVTRHRVLRGHCPTHDAWWTLQ